ncbi:hypothetical protein [Kitasatospora sp. SUK 42]|uniref:hypothetical protein n=1 Tax=Kitasatospora sp. SUK 42 TaxID=1588882 RepID=UPI0018CABA2A|nr:hypothetical protein [Kitasatospora sp. SUK 42]MBV2154700.1 hypothetical protein [Kitasatospora sp. SUK 42]
MSTNRSRRIDRDAAEHLLGGAVGGPSDGQDASLTGPDGPGRIARVLAAAAAPATTGELAGEEAALAAFREASLTPDPVVTPVRRRSMATAALARAFSTKAAAAVLGATALCGVAVAAGTGNLPVSLGGGPSEPERTVAVPGGSGGASAGTATSATGLASGASTPGGSARPSGGTGADPRAAVPSSPAGPGTPSADGHGARSVPPAALVPLCQGFADRTGKGERPRQLAADPLFAPLIEAAGGADGVTDYCQGASGRQDGDHQGATGQPSTPGRNGTGAGNGSGSESGSGAGPNAGNGKGGGDTGRNGTGGNGNGNSNGNTNGNANGNTNGEDTGGGAKPGRSGVTAPTPPAAPSPPDIRPSKTAPSEDEQSARR